MRLALVLMMGMVLSMAMSSYAQSEDDYHSKRGVYVVTLPHPNGCVVIPPIRADSSIEAVIRVMERGGFTLAPTDGRAALTVWTIEKWESPDMQKIRRDVAKYCSSLKSKP